MVAASHLRLQQSFAPIWPEMFLPTFDGLKSVLQFQLTQNKIPWHFPDLEEFLFSLTISWPVATTFQFSH